MPALKSVFSIQYLVLSIKTIRFFCIFYLLLATLYLLPTTPALAQVDGTTCGENRVYVNGVCTYFPPGGGSSTATPAQDPAAIDQQIPANTPPSPSPAPDKTFGTGAGQTGYKFKTGVDLTPENFDYTDNGLTSFVGGFVSPSLCVLARYTYFDADGCPDYNWNPKLGSVQIKVYENDLAGGGAIQFLGSIAGNFYSSPPTSTAVYLASLGENIGLAPRNAYAQVAGSGAGVIQPVLALWQATRNISYLFFIIIFMAVGFMIMFRRKINPQTVISVQAALPSLVIGLILITFSYFIAALAVDLAFVGVQLIAYLFANSGVQNSFGTPEQIMQLAQSSNIFQLFTRAGTDNIGNVYTGANQQYTATLNSLVPAGAVTIPTLLGALVGGILLLPTVVPWLIVGGAAIGALSQILIPAIVVLVLLIALFIQLFKLVFQLLITYIQLLIFTIAGPFLILYGSVPGNGNAISFWIRGLIANSLIFPVVFFVFIFAGMMLGNQTIVKSTLPLLGGLEPSFIKVLIALGLILGTPAVPNMIRGLFKVQFPPELIREAVSGLQGSAGALQYGYQRATGPAKAIREAAEKAEQEARVNRMTTRDREGRPIGVVTPTGLREAIARRLP